MADYGCEQCWSTDPSEAYRVVTKVPIEVFLIDESHFIVSVRKCSHCSQHYLQVTTETIDWEDGEDPVHRTIVPIEGVERCRLVASTPLVTAIIEAVGEGKQSVHYDWQKGEEPSTYWGTGVRVGMHD